MHISLDSFLDYVAEGAQKPLQDLLSDLARTLILQLCHLYNFRQYHTTTCLK